MTRFIRIEDLPPAPPLTADSQIYGHFHGDDLTRAPTMGEIVAWITEQVLANIAAAEEPTP